MDAHLPASGLSVAGLLGSLTAAAPAAAATIEKETFGTLPDGTVVDAYTLANDHGMRVRILTYGGIIQAIEVPDRDGNIANVVLGFSILDDYRAKNPYFGTITGRYANRIAGGRFTLGDKTYQLATNNGPNALHGGIKGFDKKVWAAREVLETDAVGLELTYSSPDGEEGYPGKLAVKVTLPRDERQRARHRIRGHNGRANRRQPHEPQLLQSGW
jgi:aldose 1-epimerase